MSIRSFNEYLTETSLSRVWSTFNERPIVAGILSASRNNLTAKENAARTMDLAGKVRSAGYGYVFVDGEWIEDGGKKVKETSLVIRGTAKDNGKLKGLIRKWMDEYDQEGALFKPEGETYVIVMTEYGPETRVGTFHPDRVADMMTSLRGRGHRSFVFESAYTSMGWMARFLTSKNIPFSSSKVLCIRHVIVPSNPIFVKNKMKRWQFTFFTWLWSIDDTCPHCGYYCTGKTRFCTPPSSTHKDD